MATPSTTTTTYPKLGPSYWRKLRAKAHATPSIKLTPSTVATILSLGSPASAQSNVVNPMQRFGLIDEDGALTDRGNKWRNDGTYADACQEIIDSVYPAELAALTNGDGAPDRTQLASWFEHRKLGASNARQAAATYAMIAEKKVPEPTEKDEQAKSRKPRAKADTGAKAATLADAKATDTSMSPPGPQRTSRPDIHLDFQIHIAADAPGDQIERIFSSMAKYLYPPA